MKRELIEATYGWSVAIALLLYVIFMFAMAIADKKNIQKNTNKACCVSVSSNQELVDKRWAVCPSWILSLDVFNRELIKEYKTRNYFGIVPEISEKQQDSIITVWEYEMSRRGWNYGDSISGKQDKFDRDCNESLDEAIYQVMKPKIKPIIRTRFR